MDSIRVPFVQSLIHRAQAVARRRIVTICLAVALHTAMFLGAYTILYAFGIVEQIPNDEKLLRWDAGWFHQLSVTGYQDANSGINAFFPLLPVVWRITGLSVSGISVLNGFCGLIGTIILSWAFRLSFRQILLVLSTPMLFYTMVPYAEALFFLWGAVLLAGLHRQKYGLVLLGLFGACLARSAATLFVPAYLFAELLWWSRQSWYVSLLRIVGGLLTIVSAVGTVMIAQYQSHGDAWAFYKVHAIWGHALRPLEFPLHSSGGINVLWLDAFALLVALCSFMACAVLGIMWLKSGPREGPQAVDFPSRAVLFSLGYCVGAGFFILAYQGGDLVGLARYIQASPFFVVLLWQAWKLPALQQKKLLGVVLCVGLVLVGCMGGLWNFNSFYAGEATVYFSLFVLYLVAYLAVSASITRLYREVATGLYVVNLLTIVYLHQLYAQGAWIN